MNAITKEQLIEDLKASTQNSSGMFEIGEDTICNLMSMLTAHPAPVAPDEMTPQQASRSYGGEVRGYRDGWNACRAAMLHGADVSITYEGKNHHKDKLAMIDHSGDSNNMVEPVTDNTNQQFESLSRGDK